MASQLVAPDSDLPQEAPPAQLTLFAKNYAVLSQARDMMAYRALGSIAAAICFCRQRRTEDAIAILLTALERYELANQELNALKVLLERKGCRRSPADAT